jgi:3-hydroxybutyryl-CoA dehydrogenase
MFGMLHIPNPGATPASVLVVVLSGFLLCAVRIRFDSLYAAWMTHLAWNWTMAVPFHALVSGIRFEAPGYRALAVGPSWLSGGAWGPEGGVFAAVGMSLGLGYFYVRRSREESSTMSDRIAVIGAGQMGNGIAHVFAQAGHDVVIVDVSDAALEQGRSTIAKNLDRQVKKGTITEETRAGVLTRVSTSTAMDAVRDASLIVEAATENRELKFGIFTKMDEIADANAILATNTSSISITEIAARTKRPEQVIGMHFMNPVPMMQLVEIIRGLATSDETTTRVMEWSAAIGKTPVEVNDYPGFVANRILLPMINEAIFCLMEGVGTPEAIDTVMKLGMNHPMGPLALADLIGLDTCLAILEVLHDGLGDSKYRPCPLLRKYVAAGWLGRKSGRGFFVYPS